MSTAGAKPKNVTFTKYLVANAAAIVKGVGVFFSTTTAGALEVSPCVAGSKCIGVAQEAQTGDGTAQVEVALLAAGGTLRVKCSGTATAGEQAICGVGGFENQTLGGGTTVRRIAGTFLESGIAGDFVEMIPNRYDAGSA